MVSLFELEPIAQRVLSPLEQTVRQNTRSPLARMADEFVKHGFLPHKAPVGSDWLQTLRLWRDRGFLRDFSITQGVITQLFNALDRDQAATKWLTHTLGKGWKFGLTQMEQGFNRGHRWLPEHPLLNPVRQPHEKFEAFLKHINSKEWLPDIAGSATYMGTVLALHPWALLFGPYYWYVLGPKFGLIALKMIAGKKVIDPTIPIRAALQQMAREAETRATVQALDRMTPEHVRKLFGVA